MKTNLLLKSLDELSPELLASEPDKTQETHPQPSEIVVETKSIKSFQPVFLTDTHTRAYRGWGINE